jgi:hypothetical protein
VLGDLNEMIGDVNQGLTKLCSECHLKDVIYERHGHRNKDFNTYARGNTCIDYILMAERLEGAIQECGYLPFNQSIISDHRGLYVDVDIVRFFGSDTLPTQPMALRDYNSKNIQQTAPFINHQAYHLETHGWFHKVKQIRQCITNNTPDHNMVEKADKRRISACQYAGKKLKRYGTIPYSPELIRMKTIDKLTTIIIRRMQKQDEDQETLQDLKHKLQHVGVTLPLVIEDYKSLRKNNRKEMVTMIKSEIKHGTVRHDYQTMAIEEAEKAGNKEKARRIRQIQRAEAISHVWKKCAHARGLTKTGGISQVLVPEEPNEDPKTCTTWKKLEDPPEIIKAITDRLQVHFGQAKDCTWTTPPLDVTMDFEACCKKAEAILTST